MSITRFLPYRGDVVDLLQREETLLLAVQHPEGQNLGLYQFSLRDFSEDSLLQIKTPHPVIRFCQHPSGLYLLDNSGDLLLMQDGAVTVVESFEAIDFVEALSEELVLLVSKQGTVIVYNPVAKKRIWESKIDQAITAVASDIQSGRFALGTVDGMARPFYEDTGAYKQSELFNIDDSVRSELHEQPITSLLFCRDENKELALISTSSDLCMFHTKIAEGKPQERTPQRNRRHAKPVLQMLNSNGRYFYSLGQDGTIKSRLNNLDASSPSSWDVSDIKVACLGQVPIKVDGGVYEARPHMIVAHGTNGSKRISLFPIVFGKEGEDVKENDKLQESELSIQGGVSWVWKIYGSDIVSERERVLDRIQNWNDSAVVDVMRTMIEVEEAPHLITKALEILQQSGHSRLPYIFQKLLKVERKSTAVAVFGYLRKVYGEKDLYPLRLAEKTKIRELLGISTRAYAELAIEGNKQAYEKLLTILNSDDEEMSYLAFQLLCGEDSEAVVPGLAGVQLALRTSNAKIITSALDVLFHKRLLELEESQMLLRSCREHENENVRRRAFHISLLQMPRLGTLLREKDNSLHKQLCEIELRGKDQETVTSAIENPPIMSEELLAEDNLLLSEMTSSYQTDISSLGALAQASLGNISALPVLMLLAHEKDVSVRQRACRGLSNFVNNPMVKQELESLMINDDNADVRFVAFTVLYTYEKQLGDHLEFLKSAQDSAHNDIRVCSVVQLQEDIKDKIAAHPELTYEEHKFPVEIRDELLLLERCFYNASLGDDAAKQACQTFRQGNFVKGDFVKTRKYLLKISNLVVNDMIFQELRDNYKKPWFWELLSTALHHQNSEKARKLFKDLLGKFSKSSQEYINLLKTGFKCKELEIRETSYVELVGNFNEPWVASYIVEALLDSQLQIRKHSLSEKGKTKLKTVGKLQTAVLKAIKSSYADLHLQAIAIIDEFPEVVDEEIVNAWIELIPKVSRGFINDSILNIHIWKKAVDVGKGLTFIQEVKKRYGTDTANLPKLIELLGYAKEDWAKDELDLFVQHENREISKSAFTSLYRYYLDRGEAAAFIERYLVDGHKKLPEVVDMLLQESSDWRFSILKKGLNLENSTLRQRVLEELMTTPDRLETSFLFSLLENDDLYIQITALRALMDREDSNILETHVSKILAIPKPLKGHNVTEQQGIWRNIVTFGLTFVTTNPNVELFDILKTLEENCRKSTWSEPGVRLASIRAIGWVIPDDSLAYLQDLLTESDQTICNEAALALTRSGDVTGLQYFYEKAFNVNDCAIGIISCGAAAEQFFLRALQEQKELAHIVFLMWVLQRSQIGGSMELIANAVTSISPEVRLQASKMLASMNDQELLFNAVVELLSEEEYFSDDPLSEINFASSASWREISELLQTYHKRLNPKKPTLSIEDWRHLGLLLGSDNSRIRTISARLFIDLLAKRKSVEQTQTRIKRYNALDVTFSPLTLHGESFSKEDCLQYSFGALTGLVRQPLPSTIRRNALRSAVLLANDQKWSDHKAVLQVALLSPVKTLRKDAFSLSLANMAKIDLDYNEIVTMALHSSRVRSDQELGCLALSELYKRQEFKKLYEIVSKQNGLLALDAFNLLSELSEHEIKILQLAAHGADNKLRARAIKSTMEKIDKKIALKENYDDYFQVLISVLENGLRKEQKQVVDCIVTLKRTEADEFIYDRLENSRQSFDVLWALMKLKQSAPVDASERILKRLLNDPGEIVPAAKAFDALTELNQQSESVQEMLIEILFSDSSALFKRSLKLLKHYTGYWANPEEPPAMRRGGQLLTAEEFEWNSSLMAKLFSALVQLASYENILQLLSMVSSYVEPCKALDEILSKIATYQYNEQVAAIRLEATKICADRYIELEDGEALQSSLYTNVRFDIVPKEISEFQVVSGCALLAKASTPLSEDENFAFRKMNSLIVDDVYAVAWRRKALYTLGKIADFRFVPSLLNLVGVDPNGKPLPSKDVDAKLQKMAISLLGHYSKAPQAEVILQVLFSQLQNHKNKKGAINALGHFLLEPTFHVPIAQTLLPHLEKSPTVQLIETLISLYNVLEIDEFKVQIEAGLEKLLQGELRGPIFEFLKGIREESDLRAHIDIYKNSYKGLTEEEREELREAFGQFGDINTLLDLLIFVTQKKRSSEVKLMCSFMKDHKDLNIQLIMDELNRELEEGFVIFNSLKTLLKAKAAQITDSQKDDIVSLATNFREKWTGYQKEIDQGIREAVTARKKVEKVWDQVLDLLRFIAHGQNEIEQTLHLKGLPFHLVKEACYLYINLEKTSPKTLIYLFTNYSKLRDLLVSVAPLEVLPDFMQASMEDVPLFHLLLHRWYEQMIMIHGSDNLAPFAAALDPFADNGNKIVLSEIALLQQGELLLALLDQEEVPENRERLVNAMAFATSEKVQQYLVEQGREEEHSSSVLRKKRLLAMGLGGVQ
jgi:hypothetical protein